MRFCFTAAQVAICLHLLSYSRTPTYSYNPGHTEPTCTPMNTHTKCTIYEESSNRNTAPRPFWSDPFLLTTDNRLRGRKTQRHSRSPYFSAFLHLMVVTIHSARSIEIILPFSHDSQISDNWWTQVTVSKLQISHKCFHPNLESASK